MRTCDRGRAASKQKESAGGRDSGARVLRKKAQRPTASANAEVMPTDSGASMAPSMKIDFVSLDQRVSLLEKQRDMLIAACVSLLRHWTRVSRHGSKDIAGASLEAKTADADLNVWLKGLS